MVKKLYKYTARDRSGILVSGEVEAENTKTVSHSLKELGYVVITIEEVKSKGLNVLSRIKGRFFAIRPSDVLLFLRQLATMLKAGLPLLPSLSNIIDQTQNAPFKKILINIASDIRGGKSLSAGLSNYPQLFSEFHVNMIKAGEAAGMLGEVLERLAAIGYEEQELKGRVQSAFAYPILLIIISLFIVITLLMFILPKFINIFEESGTRLPLATTILLFIASAMRRFWWLPVVGFAGGGYYLYHKLKSPKSRYNIHKRMLAVPVIGNLIMIMAVSRFCKIMGALTKSGIPLLNAISVSEGLLANAVLVNAISHVKQAVIAGTSLHDSLRLSGVFPPMMVQMVGVGEGTGKLDDMFLHIGDFYDKESTLVIRTLTTLIEPLLLLVMGIVVGFIALSVLLPIFNLVKVLKH